MEEIIQLLLSRLSRRGLYPEQIPRLIEDVLYIVRDSRVATVEETNQGLAFLGWGSPILDPFTFELILCLVEHEGRLEIPRYGW